MILEHGNIWDVYDKTDHFLFTANNVIKRNGALVMGAGIAKQVRDRFPGIDLVAGKEVSRAGSQYGVILGKKIGLIQTKYHWKDKSPMELICHSVSKLRAIALSRSTERFDLTLPGCGHGGQSYNAVLPFISELPDNVHVWTYKEIS